MSLQRIGPYQILRELGRGGMGVVYEAQHPTLPRTVAVKVLLPHGPQATQRFQREARAAASLSHPNLIPVLDLGLEGNHPYLVMDMVQGESLDQRIKRGGPLGADEAVKLVVSVAHAVAHAHERGTLHRDLKPANIMVDAGGVARLTDFGLARDEAAEKERLTLTGEVLGTPSYMAPEQASGERGRIGPATDVYGLGATLYALLTGRPPFEGATAINIIKGVLTTPPPPPSSIQPAIPEALEAVVLRCLEKEPEDRYPSVAAFADALQAARTSPGATEGRTLTPLVLVVLALAALLFVGGLALTLAPTKAPTSQPEPESEPESQPDPEPEPESESLPQPQEERGASRAVAWTLIERESASGPRGFIGQMSFDPSSKSALVFGGLGGDGRLREDTWSYRSGPPWTERLASKLPSPRAGVAFAHDAGRGRSVLFGGQISRGSSSSDTWAWEGETWTLLKEVRRIDSSVPLSRYYGALSYAPDREALLLFGGRNVSGEHRGDLWAFTDEWTLLDEGGPPRSGAGVAYDAARRTLVVFGGSPAHKQPSDELWEWSGAWKPIPRRDPWPGPRTATSMVYTGEAVLLFGGRGNGLTYDDAWTWSGRSWTRLTSPAWPGARSGHGLAWDSERKVAVLYGGIDPGPNRPSPDDDVQLADTWELDLREAPTPTRAVWTRHEPEPQGPPGRRQPAMAFDGERVVLASGVGHGPEAFHRDTWAWSGDRWERGEDLPMRLYGAAMARDPWSGHLVLLGGKRWDIGFHRAPLGVRLRREGDRWQQLTSIEEAPIQAKMGLGPGPRYLPALVSAPGRGSLLLLGGLPDNQETTRPTRALGEWKTPDGAWRALPPFEGEHRGAPAVAWDELRQTLVVFSGLARASDDRDLLSLREDLWEWSERGGWRVRTPAGEAPAPRYAAMTAFDGRRVLLYGGCTEEGKTTFDDLWAWDGERWTELSPRDAAPGRRHSGGFAWDSVRGVGVLFGGREGSRNDFPADTWELRLE